MISKKIKLTLLTLLVVVFIAVIGVASVSYAFDNAVFNQTSLVLQSEYMVGDVVSVPNKTLSDGNDSSDADVTVYFPSGAAMRASTVRLTETGKYTIEYRAWLNGKILKEYEYFNVYSELYSFSGDKSSAYYGLDESIYDTGRTALNIELAQGEKVTFNKIINLNDIEDNMFITFYGTPEKKGTAEVNGIYFTLTDIYDSTNTVTFQYKIVPYLGQSYVYLGDYVCAGHGDQVPRAWTYDTSNNMWRLRINDKFGTGTKLALYGCAELYGGSAIKDSFCQLGIDLDNKKAYVNDHVKSVPAEIIDMDNPNQFDKLWQGFTTGEVYLSIEAYDYTGGTFHLNIMDIAGYDFSNNVLKDTDKPVIEIDSDGYDLNALPNGNAGEDYKYPVFDAVAFDKNEGYLDIDVRAYYNYDSDGQVELPILDGYIKTARSGKYKIVYTATDSFGNVAVEEVFFFVQSAENPIEITFLGDYSTEVKVGELISIARYKVEGGAGNKNVEITFDKKCVFDQLNNVLRPMEDGILMVTYTATDITGAHETQTYEINVQTNPNPVVYDDVFIPEYLFGGMKYQFESVMGHDFNTGEDIVADVYVDGVKIENGLYTPVDKKGVNGDGEEDKSVIADSYTVTLEYKIENYTILSKDITVLDVYYQPGPISQMSINSYFVGDGLTTAVDATGVKLSTTSASKSTLSVKFAKPLLSNSVTMGLRIDSANVQDFTLVLTDITDSNNVLRVGFVKDAVNSKTYLVVNGEKTLYALGAGGFYGLGSVANIYVQNGVISDGVSVNYDFSDIFSADKVYLKLEFNGVTIGSALSAYITHISDVQLNSSVVSDRVEPFALNLANQYPTNAIKGEALTILPIVAEDLLNTYIKATVTVTITNVNGTTILLKDADANVSHEVLLSEYGTCNIEYTLIDGAKQERKPKYEVNISNLIEPKITINGSVPTTLKLGQQYTFPAAIAIDDTDGELQVYYFVVNPSLEPEMLTNITYTPKVAGRHVFRVYAMDSFGNIALKDIEFEVVK